MQMTSSNKTLRIVAAVAFVAMLVANWGASTGALGGTPTGEISDGQPNLFAPAGFTFAIWGVIYLLLGAYTVYQFLSDDPLIDAITVPYIATSVLNIAWLTAWQYEIFWLSMIIMVGLLLTLIRIHTIVTADRLDLTRTLAVRLPFNVYFGWICVATVANAATLLVNLGWRGTGLSEAQWTIVTLIVAAAIGMATTIISHSPAYGLVFVWAFWGILSKHQAAAPDGWDGAHPAVITTLQTLLPVLAVGTILGLVQWIRGATTAPRQTAAV